MDDEAIQRLLQEANDLQVQINKAMQLAKARLHNAGTTNNMAISQGLLLAILLMPFYVGIAVLVNSLRAVVDTVSFLVGFPGETPSIWRAFYSAAGALNGILAGALLKFTS